MIFLFTGTDMYFNRIDILDLLRWSIKAGTRGISFFFYSDTEVTKFIHYGLCVRFI